MSKNSPLSDNQNIRVIMATSLRLEALSNIFVFKPAQISLASFKILRILELQGPQLPSAMQTMLGSSKSNITQIIQSLEKKGLISRQQGREDRRQVLISLTAAGRAKLADLALIMHDAELHIDRYFSAEELAQHQAFFRKLNTLLNRCEHETFKKYD